MSLTKRDRFIKKFQEQFQFIQRSCRSYDEGYEDESIRLATSLRVIFHNTMASTSLIKHLNFNNKIMLSSSGGQGNILDLLSWVIDINSPQPVKTRPQLGDKFRQISIKEWWDIEQVFTYKTQKYTRKKIILTATNKDGGAHVDEELDKFYEALSAGSGIDGISITGNLTYNGEPPFQQGVNQSAKNVQLSLIRQFAHEFLAAVTHFSWLQTNR